jgi:hypothetical protein
MQAWLALVFVGFGGAVSCLLWPATNQPQRPPLQQSHIVAQEIALRQIHPARIELATFSVLG